MEGAGTIALAPLGPGEDAPPVPAAPARLTRAGALRRLIANWGAGRPANTATEVRITRLCTQRCRQCAIPWGAVPAETMSAAAFRTVAARLRMHGAGVGFISGGEPSLHPDLSEILEEALRTFPLACTLNTNLDNHQSLITERVGAAVRLGVNVQTSLDGLGALGDDLRGGEGVAERVLANMRALSEIKARCGSPSVLYANTVLNERNLEQVPEILDAVARCGWRSSIGSYHDLTLHTRRDGDLFLRPGPRLRDLVDELLRRPGITTHPTMLRGIPRFAAGEMPKLCAYLDAPVLATRLLVRENGDLYLCKGKAIGNLLREPLGAIFSTKAYRERLEEYRACPGCWNNCYTQKLLMVKPPSVRIAWESARFALGLTRARGGGR